ncbi:hypothetical protein [Deinococcus navajonensis]|uniref:Uncharacterized protein n=1 Tax=Deinococcus navajonensis TaxID=309884 RepID=A0ABV8XLE4_9DEIO
MLREYALDPNGVAALQRPVAFLDQFGRGTGRMITAHKAPQKWLREVLKQAKENEQQGLLSRSQFARLEELVRDLTTSTDAIGDRFLPKGSRGRTFEGSLPWIEATLREHLRQAFDAVISDDSRAHFTPLDADSRQLGFQAVTALDVPQNEVAFESAVGPLLETSRRLLLVDPYFNPSVKRYQTLLPHLLKSHLHIQDVTIQLNAKGERAPTLESLESNLRELQLPAGIQISVQRLQERAGAAKLHNRFLVTDVAGVIVDPGLDTSSSPGHTFTLNLIPEEQYHRLVQDYWDLMGFDVVDQMTFTP